MIKRIFSVALVFAASLALPADLPTWDDETATYFTKKGYLDGCRAKYLDDGEWASYRLDRFISPGLPWDASTIHGTTEGDDLWVAHHMVKRLQASGIPVTSWLVRRDVMRDYFIDDYQRMIQGSDEHLGKGLCHMYGWGLCDWYRDNPGHARAGAALQAINSLAALAIDWNTNSSWAKAPGESAITGGGRKWARNLRFAVAAADVSPTTANINHRDRIIDIVLQDPNWDTTYKNYFSERYTDVIAGSGSYAAGDRLANTYHMGMMGDALWNTWLVLDDEGDARAPAVRQRLIDLASFYRDFPLNGDGAFVKDMGFNVNTGARIMVGGTSEVYTSPAINPLVFGYKLTGDQSFLDKAFKCLEGFFANVASGWVGTGSPGPNNVPFYCDACISSGDGFNFLAFNKGQLQYIYAIFENGGNPPVVGIEAGRPGLSFQPALRVAPNPFNGMLTILPDFQGTHGNNEIKIFTINGELVKDFSNIVNNPLSAQAGHITWNAGDLPAGIYVVKMKSGRYQVSRTVSLLK
jgi:hypothetical protein